MSFNNNTTSNNPGHVLASAVDAEIAKFRALQQDLAAQRQDLSTVLQQETENEMVFMELQAVEKEKDENHDTVIYKKLGPVLMPQDLTDAKQTVQKRLEFIRGEKARLERRVQETEKAGSALAQKVQQMQAGLQQTTADAVRAIAAQHGGTTAA